MTVPFFVKDSTKTLVACDLHIGGNPDIQTWKEILTVLGRVACEQVGVTSLEGDSANA